MPFSSGTFSRIYNWVNEQLSSPIEISKLDAQEEDFATALNNCILRDGTGLPTAAMDWNGQNLTNVAAFTATGIVTGGPVRADVEQASCRRTVCICRRRIRWGSPATRRCGGR